jgi:hypothetical protein
MNKKKVCKKNTLAKRVVFFSLIAAICLFSCNKTSEGSEENSGVVSQQESSQSADSGTVRANPPDSPAKPKPEPRAEPVPVPTVVIPESVVPEPLRRPQQGEAARYPEDLIIGTLGRGDASAESYRFAQEILQAFLREETETEIWKNTLSNLTPKETERIIAILQEVMPEKVRIGGGRKETDESISFLLRFIGDTRWSGGEIYITQNEDTWNLENLILDEAREQGGGNSPYRFDLPPYERFF